MENSEKGTYIKSSMMIAGKCLDAFLSGAGIVLSIIGLLSGSSFGGKVVYSVIFIDSIVLLLLGVYYAYLHLHFQNQKSSYSHCIEELERKLESTEAAYQNSILKAKSMQWDLGGFIWRLNEQINDYKKCLAGLIEKKESLLQHGYSIEESEQMIYQEKTVAENTLYKTLLEKYNQFMSKVVEGTITSIKAYLRTVEGGDFNKVSISVNQLIEPQCLEQIEDIKDKPVVYTAFRDLETWMVGETFRYGNQLYRISNNTDFEYCSQKKKEYFIKEENSKEIKCERLIQCYGNCGVTARILSKYENTFRLYGFITCDIENEDLCQTCVVDKNVATIMGTASYLIGTYFAEADYLWKNSVTSEQYDSFWELLYNKITR